MRCDCKRLLHPVRGGVPVTSRARSIRGPDGRLPRATTSCSLYHPRPSSTASVSLFEALDVAAAMGSVSAGMQSRAEYGSRLAGWVLSPSSWSVSRTPSSQAL